MTRKVKHTDLSPASAYAFIKNWAVVEKDLPPVDQALALPVSVSSGFWETDLVRITQTRRTTYIHVRNDIVEIIQSLPKTHTEFKNSFNKNRTHPVDPNSIIQIISNHLRISPTSYIKLLRVSELLSELLRAYV